MALLYLLDDEVAVDERGWEWELVDGAWQPREERKTAQLRLVETDHPPTAPGDGRPGAA